MEPMGTRLISSTPQATATSTTAGADQGGGQVGGLQDEPHGRRRQVAAVNGRPAASQAVRVMLNACMPHPAHASRR